MLKLPEDLPEKNQVAMMLAGLIISLCPFLILTAIPIMLGIQPIVYPRVTTLFIVVLPLSMSYTVINRYLPDARKILKSIVIILLTAIVVSFFLYFFLYASGWTLRNDIDVYLSLLAITTGIIVFLSGLKLLAKKISERFESSKVDKEWNKREETFLIDDENLVLEELACRLDLEGTLAFVEESGNPYVVKAAGRYYANTMEQKVLEEYYLSSLSNAANSSGHILPRGFPAEFYFPFISKNFTCGLFLGYRRSRITLAVQEIPIISTIAYQACQRLKAVYSIKFLSAKVNDIEKRLGESQRERRFVALLKRWLFKNFEEERKKLAREIHDGPLQISLHLTRKIKEITALPVYSAESGTFSEMHELMKDLSYELRTICSGLRPSVLKDLGLIPTLEAFIQETMNKELISITLEVNGLSKEQRLDEDIELAIFRLLQEGIHNVIKHSDSGKAKITLTLKEQRIDIELIDYGKGFDTNIIQEGLQDELLNGNHFGIIGMKERIESLGGEFNVFSRLGEGTTIRATLPN